MGYNTDFFGSFSLNKKLDDETKAFLMKIHDTRRMKRDMSKLFPNMSADELFEKYGVDGEFFVDGSGDYEQDNDASVVDYNCPPSTQPSLWCQWIPTDGGDEIEWDGAEKAYDMDNWIIYLIDKILRPRGYVLNGNVKAQGDDFDDRWMIEIVNNEVKIIPLD